MYICLKCGKLFDIEDMHKVEVFRVDGFAKYEYENCCPDCGSEDFTEAVECEICGNLCDPETLHGGCVCDSCLRDGMTADVLAAYAEDDLDAFAEFLRERSKT